MRLFLFCFVAGCFVSVGVWWILKTQEDRMANAYAGTWASSMVIEYSKANPGKIPTSWDDLRTAFDTLTVRSGRPFGFDDIKHRINIDWAILDLKLSGTSTEGLVFSMKGSGHSNGWLSRHDPNQLLDEFLSNARPEK